ncbi:hypothetical protein TSAR_005345 [Trichomalopsis sarcophagae]|uniref:Uncharacterized protein n=1 Tax=Trichomalopsis sarcophagae TaxID=543379 RepID=A0A232FAB5_9HYME|nr:hypothetical protein TSAR_005345 [Trichomalopsis sarcophagae]
MLEDELLQKKHGLADAVKKKLIDLMKKYKNMDEEGKRKFLFNILDTLEKQKNKYMSRQSNWMDTFGGYWALIIAVVLLIFVIGRLCLVGSMLFVIFSIVLDSSCNSYIMDDICCIIYSNENLSKMRFSHSRITLNNKFHIINMVTVKQLKKYVSTQYNWMEVLNGLCLLLIAMVLFIFVFGRQCLKKMFVTFHSLFHYLKNTIILDSYCSSYIDCSTMFFSYKLYKSLSERERKREEKKKNKQMKKKK